MKAKHWIGLAGLAYFLAVGVNELISSDNATLDKLPDFGMFTSGNAGAPDYVAGGLDLAAAAAIYFFVLHKEVF